MQEYIYFIYEEKKKKYTPAPFVHCSSDRVLRNASSPVHSFEEPVLSPRTTAENISNIVWLFTWQDPSNFSLLPIGFYDERSDN